MSKRNIAYVKPQDPSFLVKLKQQIGFKEGPTVETKRQKVEEDSSDTEDFARTEPEDEKPQIVVLRPGIDLSAEEAADEEKRIAEDKQNAPADLSQPIIFKKKTSKKPAAAAAALEEGIPTKKSSKKQLPVTKAPQLSFDPEEDEDFDA